MKRFLITITMLFSVAVMAVATQAQTPNAEAEKQAALNRQLTAEIKQLRLELLQQRIEFQQWKTQQIERELQQAKAEQQRLEEETQRIFQELSALSLTQGQAEDETLKSELSGERLQLLRARQEPINNRVAELNTKFQQEETRLKQIIRQLKNATGEKAQ